MANNNLLGCWGFIVGAVLTVIVGGMAFGLVVALIAGLRYEGMAAFADPLLWHKAGELLVVGFTILATYTWVFRPAGLTRFIATTRYMFWVGAGLNLVAWLLMAGGTRRAVWILTLAALGFAAPWMFSRARYEPPPPLPPGG